ncbi:hypothetical protein ACWET9_23490 [Streptomyces sp. NPDC004059]
MTGMNMLRESGGPWANGPDQTSARRLVAARRGRVYVLIRLPDAFAPAGGSSLRFTKSAAATAATAAALAAGVLTAVPYAIHNDEGHAVTYTVVFDFENGTTQTVTRRIGPGVSVRGTISTPFEKPRPSADGTPSEVRVANVSTSE